MSSRPDIDTSDSSSRSSWMSYRRLSGLRRVAYFILTPMLRGVLALLWRSYRVQAVIGADVADRLIADGTVCIPCYWHQQHLLCANAIRKWIRRGFAASIVISASVDGEIPSRIVGAWGAEVIRGSANQTGALVMRDMQNALRSGRSIITTPDGPNGPIFKFKLGNILVARTSKAPFVPLAGAADRSWHLRNWDRMIIPKPFAKVAVAIGEPYAVPGDAPVAELESHRANLEAVLMALMQRAEQALD